MLGFLAGNAASKKGFLVFGRKDLVFFKVFFQGWCRILGRGESNLNFCGVDPSDPLIL
jgi:hypothetical protein